MSEGVIKFWADWIREPIEVDGPTLSLLNRWRSRFRDAELIGALPGGVGFGNISVGRGGPFLITGSGTGGLTGLDPSDLALVTGWDLHGNSVACRGLTEASSETLSHAAIYAAHPGMGAVVHVHSRALWERYRDVMPTTAEGVEYGTAEMGLAIRALALSLPPDGTHTLVMGGHPDGLISFGRTLEVVGEELLRLLHLSP